MSEVPLYANPGILVIHSKSVYIYVKGYNTNRAHPDRTVVPTSSRGGLVPHAVRDPLYRGA